MSFVPMKTLIDTALEHGFAVPAFCAWNGTALKAILETARKLEAPVITMNGPPEYELLSPGEFAAMAYPLKQRYDVPAALLLDHGDSRERVRECVEAGYTSVMLDYSARPFEENAAALKAVCIEMHPKGITVEGEIGTVGLEGWDFDNVHHSEMTDVGEAQAYVEATGIDIVAVSIGNVHGVYRGEPSLDFDLLKNIREAVNIPIALHGSSGLSEEDIRKGVSLGIAKVNVATELVKAVRESLLSQWTSGSSIWMPLTLAEAYTCLEPVLTKWFRMTGAEGKAGLFTLPDSSS